jgi:lysozyme
MKTSEKGIGLIKKFEGFRAKPYLCSAGVPTIGYGTTRYNNNKKVTLADRPITEEKATEILLKQLEPREFIISHNVKKELTQDQFDALVSFVYNVGAENFLSSTLLKVINKSPRSIQIEKEFAKWIYAGKKQIKGLILRRNEETNLYFSRI